MSLPRPYYGHQDVDHEFGFHPATPVTGAVHEAVRQITRAAAHRFVELVPEGPLKTLAIRQLQQAMMYANAAVATQTDPIWQNEMAKLRGDREFYPRLVLDSPEGETEQELLAEAAVLINGVVKEPGIGWHTAAHEYGARYQAYLDRRKRASDEATSTLRRPTDQRPYRTEDAEHLARALHYASRYLSSSFGYEVQPGHDVAWSELPPNGRAVMTAMAATVLGVSYPVWVVEVCNNPSSWATPQEVESKLARFLVDNFPETRIVGASDYRIEEGAEEVAIRLLTHYQQLLAIHQELRKREQWSGKLSEIELAEREGGAGPSEEGHANLVRGDIPEREGGADPVEEE